jgi:hypothetical protein
MLQSKAGYIDARPHIRQLDEVLLQRTAGPYIGSPTPIPLGLRFRRGREARSAAASCCQR